MKKVVFFYVFLQSILLVSFASNIRAETPSMRQIAQYPTEQIAGRIIAITGNTIAIVTDSSIKEVTVPQNISVTKNSLATRFSELKRGDHISVIRDVYGEVLSIEAESAGITDISQKDWLFPVTFATLCLLLLLIAAMRNITMHQKIPLAS